MTMPATACYTFIAGPSGGPACGHACRFELFKHTFAQQEVEGCHCLERTRWTASRLKPAELEEYRFKRGYAYFQEDDRGTCAG